MSYLTKLVAAILIRCHAETARLEEERRTREALGETSGQSAHRGEEKRAEDVRAEEEKRADDARNETARAEEKRLEDARQTQTSSAAGSVPATPAMSTTSTSRSESVPRGGIRFGPPLPPAPNRGTSSTPPPNQLANFSAAAPEQPPQSSLSTTQGLKPDELAAISGLQNLGGKQAPETPLTAPNTSEPADPLLDAEGNKMQVDTDAPLHDPDIPMQGPDVPSPSQAAMKRKKRRTTVSSPDRPRKLPRGLDLVGADEEEEGTPSESSGSSRPDFDEMDAENTANRAKAANKLKVRRKR